MPVECCIGLAVGYWPRTGITLSWRVTDLAATRTRLVQNGLAPTEMRSVGDAVACYLTDPEGHRIEIWSEGSEP